MKSIFVSSTFRDMQAERDILIKEVLPRINEQLYPVGKTFQFTDLRWGIDTLDADMDEANLRILSVCSSEIERCHPYFLVILGDRYGYVPENAEQVKKAGFELEDEGMSVTHMEIIKGIFENKDKNSVFVYIRHMDDEGMTEEDKKVYFEQNPDRKIRLEKLKSQLRKDYPDCIREYEAEWDAETGRPVSESFAQLVLDDLEGLISREIKPEGEHFLEEHYLEIEKYRKKMTEQVFVEKNRICDCLEGINGAKVLYVIYGQGGTGKSVLMSLLHEALLGRGDASEIIYCSHSPFFDSAENILRYMVFRLLENNKLTLDYKEYEDLSYDELLNLVIKMREYMCNKTFFFLDGVEQSSDQKRIFMLMNWLHQFCNEYVQLVVSVRELSLLENSYYGSYEKGKELVHCKDEMVHIAEAILEAERKQIHRSLLKKLAEAYDTPLKMQMAITRLIHLDYDDFSVIYKEGGGIEEITAYIARLLDEIPREADGLVLYLMRQFCQRKGEEQNMVMMKMMALSSYGISEKDMPLLAQRLGCSWNPVIYAELICKLRGFFEFKEDGRVDFSHHIMKESICAKMEEDGEKLTYARVLAEYYMSCPIENKAAWEDAFCIVLQSEQADLMKRLVLAYKNDTDRDADGVNFQVILELMRHLLPFIIQDKTSVLTEAVDYCRDAMEEFSYCMNISGIVGMAEIKNSEKYLVSAAVMLAELFEHCKNPIPDYVGYTFQRTAQILQDRVSEENRTRIMELYRQTMEKLADRNPETTNVKKREKPVVGDPSLMLLSKSEALQVLRKRREYSEMVYLGNEILTLYEELPETDANCDFIIADVYNQMSLALKELKQWEDAIQCTGISLEIYQYLAEGDGSEACLKKVRTLTYNLANVYEAWAMEEEKDRQLWEKTAECYGKVYELEYMELGKNTDFAQYQETASALSSYGTALLHTGETEEGIRRYREAIRMLKEFWITQSDMRVFQRLMCTYLEEIYQLYLAHQQPAVEEFIKDWDKIWEIYKKEKRTDKGLMPVRRFITDFTDSMNGLLHTAFREQQVDEAVQICSRLIQILKPVLFLADDDGIYNFINYHKNIADILYLNKKDYGKAGRIFEEMLMIPGKYSLIDSEFRHIEPVLDSMCMAFSRWINSSYKNGKPVDFDRVQMRFADLFDLIMCSPKYSVIPGYVFYAVSRKLDPECIEVEICILEIALGITLEMEEEPALNRQVAEMIEERLRTVL